MFRQSPVVAALALIVSAGVVQSLWIDRRQGAQAREPLLSQLDRFPSSLGNWEGQPIELDPADLRVGKIEAYLGRRYVNRHSGETATILLVGGLPGPISVHTPDVCFTGAGFEQVAPEEQYSLKYGPSDRNATFWTADFRASEAGVPVHLRILWSWNSTGRWLAPSNPRWEFASAGFLYKLYVVREMPRIGERSEDDPDQDSSIELLRQLLPELEQSFSVSGS